MRYPAWSGCLVRRPRHGDGVLLLPMLAADPRIPAAFRDACVQLVLDPQVRSWRDDVVQGLACNPDLSLEHEAALLAATPSTPGSAAVRHLLLHRPGLTEEDVVRMLAQLRPPLRLQAALALLDDRSPVAARAVLRLPNCPTTLLEELITFAADPALVVAAARILGCVDLAGHRRRVTHAVAARIVKMAARVPGARASLLTEVTHPRLRKALVFAAVLAETAGPHPPLDRGGWSSRARVEWEAWLSRDDVTAEQAVAELRHRSPLDPFTLRDLWTAALTLVADPEGVLAAAAVVTADPAVLSAVLADEHQLAFWRREAACRLLSAPRSRLTGSPYGDPGVLRTVLSELIDGAPVPWLRQLLIEATDPFLVMECLRQPGVAPGLIASCAARMTARRLTERESRSWDELLLTAAETPADLRAEAAARLRGIGGKVLIPAPEGPVAALLLAGAGAPTDRGLVDVGGARLDALDPTNPLTGPVFMGWLPLPLWLGVPAVSGYVNVAADWAGPVVATVLPALTDPDVARTVLSLMGAAQQFGGTLAELVDTARILAAPADIAAQS
jgi:hypothetical protein